MVSILRWSHGLFWPTCYTSSCSHMCIIVYVAMRFYFVVLKEIPHNHERFFLDPVRLPQRDTLEV